MNIDTIKADWQERRFSCELWTDAPGARWENFVHDVDELVLLLDGEVEFKIADQIFHPKVGEELLISAHTIHSVRNVGHSTSRWLYGYKNSTEN